MSAVFQIFPIGVVRKKEDVVWLEIFAQYSDALLGLDGFSHIKVLYWLHGNDTPVKRGVLQVHPRNDKANPLTGVFATHSPLRPNPLGLTRCRILAVDGNRIKIEEIDAFDGSPVIDIKCFIPSPLSEAEIRLPDWV
ncbi:MAG: tRNA (N6-threonylcarbamoyladenosine(37)-N6)-methyltransferase TrmO [Desulfobacterales bacterium]|nr:MAG: tRNA (N6-threonylcarbamoyladenosine(37)-N6)-methyltransferase TrmO [Desulfobacterales bacterium]